MTIHLYAKATYLEILCSLFILLGGLLLAFILNLLSVLTLRFELGHKGLASGITLKPVLIHWAFIGASSLMVEVILQPSSQYRNRPVEGPAHLVIRHPVN